MASRKKQPKSCILCGVRISGLRKTEVVKLPESFTPIYTVNMEFLYWAEKIPEFREALNRGLCVPDGKWVVWLIKLKCGVKADHLPGSRIIFDFLELADKKGLRVLLLGSTNEVLEKTKEVLEKRYKNVKFYTFNPGRVDYPFDDQKLKEIANYIESTKPQMVFVALGPPKQELLIDKLTPVFKRSGTLLAMGVGGTFDMIAGKIKQAPEWVSRIGLEWLWRLFEGRRFAKIIRSFVTMLKIMLRDVSRCKAIERSSR